MSATTTSNEAAWHSEALRLLADDTPQARTEIYQRLLYGSNWSDFIRSVHESGRVGLPPATARLLATVDYGRLGVEQRARARNLNSHLARSCSSLYLALAPEVRQEIQVSFVNSTDFWLPKARTLVENFCLFAYERLSPSSHGFARDVARLCGVMSGLSFSHDARSPWLDVAADAAALPIDGGAATESFITEWELIDENGAPPDESNLSRVSRPKRQRVIVVKRPTGKIILMSLSV